MILAVPCAVPALRTVCATTSAPDGPGRDQQPLQSLAKLQWSIGRLRRLSALSAAMLVWMGPRRTLQTPTEESDTVARPGHNSKFRPSPIPQRCPNPFRHSRQLSPLYHRLARTVPSRRSMALRNTDTAVKPAA